MKKMKTTLVFLVLLTSSFSLSAQTTVSIMTGLHSSNVSTQGVSADFLSINSIHRFSAGLGIEQALDPTLSLRTGVTYLQKGFQISEGTNINLGGIDLPVGLKGVAEIHTLNVPLMLQANIKGITGVTPYFSAGPSISYATAGYLRTKAKAILDFSLSNTKMNLSSEDFKRLGVEANALAGIKIPYGKGKFIAEVGYNHALTDFTSDNFIVDAGIRPKGWSFNLGYGISF